MLKKIGIIVEIPCEQIRPFKKQPRTYFDPKKMDLLLESIRVRGQDVPGVVKVLPPGYTHKYELIDGERRFRCCCKLGRPFKARVQEGDVSEKQQYLVSLLANFHNAGHTHEEIMEAVCILRVEYGMTVEMVARNLGLSVQSIHNYSSLKRLHPQVIRLMHPDVPKDKRLKMATALRLVDVPYDEQHQVAQRISSQGLTVNQTDVVLKKELNIPRKEYKRKASAHERRRLKGIVSKTLQQTELLLDTPMHVFDTAFNNAEKDRSTVLRELAKAQANCRVIQLLVMGNEEEDDFFVASGSD